MKKSNILSLIQYHIEKNDIAFIKEALLIAEDFAINDDLELSNYIIDLLKPITNEYMYINPELSNIQAQLIKNENLIIDVQNQFLFKNYRDIVKNRKKDLNDFLLTPVFIKLWNEQQLFKGYLIKIQDKPQEYKILPFEYNSSDYNFVFRKIDVEWLQTTYHTRYQTNDFIMTKSEKQEYYLNKKGT
ncbi:hypothetical protein V2P24_00985 [Mycoplasma putrefaciens]|uniref:hypothetical protein n=1 Tax=Mycoplasma putrefaciens TaxID=2123 RepID=UPI003DA43188